MLSAKRRAGTSAEAAADAANEERDDTVRAHARKRFPRPGPGNPTEMRAQPKSAFAD